MALIRQAIKSLRTPPPNFASFFRPSTIPVVRAQPKRTEWYEESLDNYCTGGYHPVRLGDTLGDRYSIIRKLGYGLYATVWLAKDLSSKRHVALKVLKSKCYGGVLDLFELDILKHIKHVDPGHPGHKSILHMLDHFVHKGPHGNHVCMAFEPMGHDVYVFSKRYQMRKMQVVVVKELARQLLRALDYLHGSCGVIHTDIKPRNILVGIKNAESVIDNHLWAFQHRVPEEPSQMDHVVRSEFLPTELPDWSYELDFKLVDFGVASWVNNHLYELIQPQYLRAPEVILGAKWDTGADIWNTACVLYELITGRILFECKECTEGSHKWTAEENHFAQMMECFGPLPKDLLADGERSREFFDTDGNLKNIPEFHPQTLGKLIKHSRPDLEDGEVDSFEAFLQGMLRYRPRDRKTAGELLRDPWLQE